MWASSPTEDGAPREQLDAAQARELQAKLCSAINLERDSLRFYYLGNNYESKIEHFGVKAGYKPEGFLEL